MTISARVIADSTYEGGTRLTTFVLRYPRFIHAEFMTHRVFSRNAASSRAIPVAKMIQAIKDDPAMPVFWGKNQAGMQAAEELSDTDNDVTPMGGVIPSSREQAKLQWLAARDSAIEHVEDLLKLNLHKQIANRILEPWMHIEVVVTATDFANFYALRDHPMAQPEIQELAKQMLAAHNASIPIVLKPGQWHLPFINTDEYTDGNNGGLLTLHPDVYVNLAKLSAARCARVSYLNHEGKKTTYEEDMALFDRLMGGEVKHASPTEHQARVPVLTAEFDEGPVETDDYEWNQLQVQIKPSRISNLRGWIQHRKLIEGETVKEYKGFK